MENEGAQNNRKIQDVSLTIGTDHATEQVSRENEGAHHTSNVDDASLTTGTDDASEQTWDSEEFDIDALLEDEDASASTDNDAQQSDAQGSKVRSTYKRHSMQQIQALEASFKWCAHPDEEMRKALAVKIGMEPTQVKHWFQNRRSQNKVKSLSQANNQLHGQNAFLKAENVELRKRVLERSCFACVCLMAPPELLTGKERLIVENARLKEAYQRAQTRLKELSRGAPLPLAAPSIAQDHATLLLHHAERAVREFLALAAASVPMWLPTVGDGEVLNFGEYAARMFPRLLGACPDGFVSMATRETGIVWATPRDLVGVLTDAGRWSQMFPGIVAAVTARDVGSSGMLGSADGLIQLINAELWVQSPRVPNHSVKFLRFTKMMENGRQWAVVDVSIDAILAVGQEGGVEHTRCGLMPSGCLIEEMDGGCSKVTWIVHAEYDQTSVPPLFRPFLHSGQALGACRLLATLKRKYEFMGILKNSFPAGDGNKGMMEMARRMTASFYAAISGPATLPGSNVSEWRGGSGARGAESFEASVRMVMWTCAGGVPGRPASAQVLSAVTTVWLPGTAPRLVLDYLCDERRRGEWDVRAAGAEVNGLGSIITGNLHGNAISIFRPDGTDATNEKMLVLQETCSDKSCSMVVYSPIEETTLLAIANGGDPASSFFLPSGFAILPDGHRKASRAPSATASSSSGAPPPWHRTTTGCLLTAAYQTLLPDQPPTANRPAGAFDVVGKQLCFAIEKVKDAVEANVVVAA